MMMTVLDEPRGARPSSVASLETTFIETKVKGAEFTFIAPPHAHGDLSRS
jgi:hypothetical protein